jgi:hypothetical protein
MNRSYMLIRDIARMRHNGCGGRQGGRNCSPASRAPASGHRAAPTAGLAIIAWYEAVQSVHPLRLHLFIVPLADERTRSMFAFLIAAGAVFLAVAVSAAINLAGPSQWR